MNNNFEICSSYEEKTELGQIAFKCGYCVFYLDYLLLSGKKRIVKDIRKMLEDKREDVFYLIDYRLFNELIEVLEETNGVC